MLATLTKVQKIELTLLALAFVVSVGTLITSCISIRQNGESLKQNSRALAQVQKTIDQNEINIQVAKEAKENDLLHNKLSLRPILRFSYRLGDDKSNNESKKFHFSIANYGQGPAIIESVSIKYESKNYDGKISSLQELIDEKGLKIWVKGSIPINHIIESNQVYTIFSTYSDGADTSLDRRRKDFFGKLKFEIKYKSLYSKAGCDEECWTEALKYESTHTPKVG